MLAGRVWRQRARDVLRSGARVRIVRREVDAAGVVVGGFELAHVDARALQPAFGCVTRVDLEPEHVVVALVVDRPGPLAWLVDCSLAFRRDVRERKDRRRRQSCGPVMRQRAPDVGVRVLSGRMLGAGRVGDFGLVAGEQRLQAAARVGRPREIDARKAIEVARLADFGFHDVRHLVEVAATERGEPLAAAVREFLRREGVRVDQAQTQFVVRVRRGVQRAGIDDRAHAVAVLGGEAAGKHVEPVDDALVQQAGWTLQHPEVERLVQRQAVEDHQRLVGVATTHVGETREAVARGARQSMHDLEHVFREPWQRVDFLLRQECVDLRVRPRPGYSGSP